MHVDTKAIVIATTKYGDTSLIVKCFTESLGLRSYILKGVYGGKKKKIRPAYFLPLSMLQITVPEKHKSLGFIKDVKVEHHYQSVHTDITKNTIAIFLSEVLSMSIQEEEPNSSLFHFLENSLLWLDTHDRVSNFHMIFLLNLTKFLGFYPDADNDVLPYFDLLEAVFTDQIISRHYLKEDELQLFKKLLGTEFDAIDKLMFSSQERQIILKTLILYFELHLQGFKKPKSLAVLNEVYS